MNKPLTIAFDARFYKEAGPGRYVKNILEQLELIDQTNTYYVFMKKDKLSEYEPKSSNFIKVEADYTWYSFSEQILFLLKLLRYNADLLYVPHFNIPVLYPKKIITAIPDIIMHSFSTEAGTTLPKPYFRLKKLVYKLVTRWAIYRSRYVIVPTHTTYKDIQTVFGTPSEKLILAPEGVDPAISPANTTNATQLLADFNLAQPFILYVGSMYEHKNLSRLVAAFGELCNNPDFKLNLVLAGKCDKFSERIAQQIFELRLTQRIFMPGQSSPITDTQMNTLRQVCDFYVFPSLKEGFSLTPMEAMIFNKACTISDIECHKEIYKNAVLYFDPFEINDISAKILALSENSDLRQDLVDKGKKLLELYNWQKTAQTTLSTFNRVFE